MAHPVSRKVLLILVSLHYVQSQRPCDELKLLQGQALTEIIEYGNMLRQKLTTSDSDTSTYKSKLNENDLESLGDVLFNTFTFTANFTWEIFEADCTTFVTTGDISQMWLRDSSVQMSTYTQHLPFLPSFSKVLESIMLRQIRFFLGDPYGSAFYVSHGLDSGPNKNECSNMTFDCPTCVCNECTPTCSLYTYQHDFELDSPLFMFLLQYKFWKYSPKKNSNVFFQKHSEETLDAIKVMINLFQVEQYHHRDSPYYYKPLPREFKDGTGLIWSFARPSDDQVVFGYNIPQNLMAVSVLEKLNEMNDALWNDTNISTSIESLKQSIINGINEYGIINKKQLLNSKHIKADHDDNDGNVVVVDDDDDDDELVFAFEVDGLGNYSKDILDDANMPNLLWLPYVGYPASEFPPSIYQNTRNLVLSTHNLNYFTNSSNPSYFGLGSQHETIGLRPVWPGPQCESHCIWHLGLVMQAMTSPSPSSSLASTSLSSFSSIDSLLRKEEEDEVMSCYYQVMNTSWHGYMHEGFSVENETYYNRDLFGWANAVFSEWIISKFIE